MRFAGSAILSCSSCVPVTFALLVVARVLRLVADRLRLPRNALGACPRAPRRRADLPGADPRCRGRRQPDRLPAASHPRLRPARAPPVTAASWLWFCLLGVASSPRMWIVGVRDWRCHVLAVTSPVVVHGLFYGNLTILLLVPLALAWRYRDRPRVAGIAVGVAVAAKLFVWPLVVWLLLTRRFRAAAWAAGSAVVLVLGAWALIGFEGLIDYPALLRDVQDVYAVRSVSLATVAGAARCFRLGRGGASRPSRALVASRPLRWLVAADRRRSPRVRARRGRAASWPRRSSGRTTRRSCSCRSR